MTKTFKQQTSSNTHATVIKHEKTGPYDAKINIYINQFIYLIVYMGLVHLNSAFLPGYMHQKAAKLQKIMEEKHE
jgi:hypothetical protein